MKAVREPRQGGFDALIADWTRTLTFEQLETLMIDYSVPAGRIYRAVDMVADPHSQAREALVDIETPRWGTVKMQNSFSRLSDTPGGIHSPAPAEIGQENEYLYRELLGMDDAEIAQLTEAGAI